MRRAESKLNSLTSGAIIFFLCSLNITSQRTSAPESKITWPSKTPSLLTICQWIQSCDNGSFSLNGDYSSRRSSTTNKRTKWFCQSLRNLSELKDNKIGCIRTILKNKLTMGRIASVWEPYQLTEIQKKRRFECCIEDQKNELGEDEWRRRYIATDEMRVFFSPKPWKCDLRMVDSEWSFSVLSNLYIVEIRNRTLLVIAFSYAWRFAKIQRKEQKLAGKGFNIWCNILFTSFAEKGRGFGYTCIIWRQENHSSTCEPEHYVFLRELRDFSLLSSYSPVGCDC